MGRASLEPAPPSTRSRRRSQTSSAAAGCAGRELEVRRLDDGQVRGELAGYQAKYATKSTEQAGGVLHRVSEQQLDELPVREHVRAYMREAFELASDPGLAGRRFGA